EAALAERRQLERQLEDRSKSLLRSEQALAARQEQVEQLERHRSKAERRLLVEQTRLEEEAQILDETREELDERRRVESATPPAVEGDARPEAQRRLRDEIDRTLSEAREAEGFDEVPDGAETPAAEGEGDEPEPPASPPRRRRR